MVLGNKIPGANIGEAISGAVDAAVNAASEAVKATSRAGHNLAASTKDRVVNAAFSNENALGVEPEALRAAAAKVAEVAETHKVLVKRAFDETDLVSLYAKSGINRVRLENQAHSIDAKLTASQLQLYAIKSRMEAIAEAVEMADGSIAFGLQNNLIDEASGEVVDPELALTLLLFTKGEQQLAIESNLFKPGDQIAFGLNANGEFTYRKAIDVDLGVGTGISIKMLEDGTYETKVSGSAELSAALGYEETMKEGKASADASLGVHGRRSIIFKSENAAEAAGNLNDIKSVATPSIDWIDPQAHNDLVKRIPGFPGEPETKDSAVGRLWDQWDAVELSDSVRLSGDVSGKIDLNKLGVDYGDIKFLEEFQPDKLSLSGGTDIGTTAKYRYNRVGEDSVSLILDVNFDAKVGSSYQAQSGPLPETFKKIPTEEITGINAEGGHSQRLKGSAAIGIHGSPLNGVEKITLTASGELGREFAASAGVETETAGNHGATSATAGYSNTSSDKLQFSVSLDPKKVDAALLKEALAAGDLDKLVEGAALTDVKVKEISTSSASIKGSLKAEGLGEFRGSGSLSAVDSDEIFHWQPDKKNTSPEAADPIPTFEYDMPEPTVVRSETEMDDCDREA